MHEQHAGPTDDIPKAALEELVRQLRGLAWVDIPKTIKILFLPLLLAGLFLGGFFILFFVAAIFAGWYGLIYHNIKTKFWKDFAAARGWTYEEKRTIEGEKALLFRQGRSRTIAHSVRGEYNGQPLSIFEYQYTIGSGKSKTTYHYTIFEIQCAGTFPHFFLNNVRNGDYVSLAEKFWLPKLPLPSEFEKQFVLYAPKQYEIEAFQIFSPETLQFLLAEEWPHDFELVDSELIISRAHHIKGGAELEAELAAVQKLADHLAPKLGRMRFAQVGDFTPQL